MENEKYRILLVEDDRVDQMAFERFVKTEDLRYDCTIAKSAAEARETLESERFDIVVMDYMLGDGTAFDVMGQVEDIPIIIMTGAGNQEVAVRAMKAGAYDYLIKDLEQNHLKVMPITIENAIRHKNAEDQFRMLSHAIKNVNESVYIADMNDKIVFVNQAFCETYGYGQDDILGRPRTVLEEDESTGGADVTGALSKKRELGSKSEFYHKRKDGSKFPVWFSKSVLKDGNGSEVAIVGVARDITEHKQAEEERERLIVELQDALASVKTLKGLLPICASCKKIRDDKGYWNQLEKYIGEHSEAEFSHGLCPKCAKMLYPGVFGDKK